MAPRRGRPAQRPFRHGPTRVPRKTVLVVCEGQTERQYFVALRRSLKLSTAAVEIGGRSDKSAAIHVVERANELNRKRGRDSTRDDYDEVWCVMDVEVPEQATLARAIDRARQLKFEVALSNPCFDFWYLLHFESCGTTMNGCAVVERRLKRKKYLPKYTKGQDYSSILDPRTEQASANAEQLWRSQWSEESDPRNCNPSTNVHQLVKRLQDIAANG